MISSQLDFIISMRNVDSAELNRQCDIIGEMLKRPADWSNDPQRPDEDESNSGKPVVSTTSTPPAPSEPDQQSQSLIMNVLNDDCLREIFEKPELRVWDLVSLANVCKRFNVIARQAFAAKYDGKYDENGFTHIELWQMEELFRTFGQLITTIDLFEFDYPSADIVVPLMLEQCKNVTHLKCRLFFNDTALKLRSLMPRLIDLTIECHDDIFDALFDSDTVYLLQKLSYKCLEPTLADVKLPHLIDFELISDRSSQWKISNYEFFAVNPQLKVLKLKNCKFNGGIDRILEHLPNLEELDDSQTCFESEKSETFACFAQLKHLKRYACYFRRFESISFILNALHEGQVNLEELSLYQILNRADNLIDALCRLKSLRKLGPCGGFSDQHFIRLVRELSNLQSIDVFSVHSGNVIPKILRQGKQLKEAYFRNTLREESSPPLLDKQRMDEIDAIWRNTNMTLRVHLTIDDIDLDMESFPVGGIRLSITIYLNINSCPYFCLSNMPIGPYTGRDSEPI